MNELDAIKASANEYPGGIEALHLRVCPDVSLESFQKQLRGSQGFKLGVLHAALITEYCHDAGVPSAAAYVTALAARVGATVQFGPRPERAVNVLQDMTVLIAELSDVMREVARAGLGGRYTLNEIKRIQREATEAMAALQQLVADVEAAHEAGKPAHLRAAT
jgi:hypothetical protein